jgi:hypothetical protein
MSHPATPRPYLSFLVPSLWLIASACGEVTHETVDASVQIDTPPIDTPPIDAPGPTTNVQVTTTGDDANDGLTNPVKTLKRALAIATSNGAIRTITLAAGKYGAANGETYPYLVPANVTILGAAAGGTILAGTGAEKGLTIDTGGLSHLQLESFGTAVSVTGTATLSTLTFRVNKLAVDVATAGLVTADALDVTGVPGACNDAAINAAGAARVAVTGLGIHTTGTFLSLRDQSIVTITGASAAGQACGSNGPMIAHGGKALTIAGSTIDAGGVGISLTAGTPNLTLTNTVISNMRSNAITGSAGVIDVTGGEIRNSGHAFDVVTATIKLTNTALKGNLVFGIVVRGAAASPSTLLLRGTTVSGNGIGIYLLDYAIADLGTAANPGNNIIQNNVNIGLLIEGANGARTIDAAGNTWMPSVQGANVQGKYSPQTLAGPIPPVDGNNFAVLTGWKLQF